MMTRLSKVASFRLLLLLSVGLGCCQELDAGPDFIKPCAVDGRCDDGECAVFGENSTAKGALMFYQYVVEQDADGRATIGNQYFICACNYIQTVPTGPNIAVEADSICKVNEFKMMLPEDSAEQCPFDDTKRCGSYCKDVTFADWSEANEFPEGERGIRAISAQNDRDNYEDCVCIWGEEKIVGCTYDSSKRYDAGPDFIKPCAVDGRCDDGECVAFGESSTATGALMFYQDVVERDADGRATIGNQYYICACNYIQTYQSGLDIYVTADSICKVNEFKMMLPEDSAEPCPFDDKNGCHSYCNDVTFAVWSEANEFPEGAGGKSAISSSTDEDCVCIWGEEKIVGCTFPSSDESTDAKPFVASGLVFAAAAVMGVMALM